MNATSYLGKKERDIGKVVIFYPFTHVNPYYDLPPIAAGYLQAAILEIGREAKGFMRYSIQEYYRIWEAVYGKQAAILHRAGHKTWRAIC